MNVNVYIIEEFKRLVDSLELDEIEGVSLNNATYADGSHGLTLEIDYAYKNQPPDDE